MRADPVRLAAPPPGRKAQHGLSIVELMVGLVVSMLVGLAAAGTAMMFTASQRQGIGAGSVSLNGSSTLAAIKSDAAQGGLGFFNGVDPLCATWNISVGATAHADNGAFAPVTITRDGDHDILDVVYASVIEAGSSVLTAAFSDGTSAQLMTLLPAANGQAVMLSPPSDIATRQCLVRTVTGVTASTATTSQALTFAATGTHNGASFVNAVTFGTMSRVTLLGALRWNRYRVVDGNLVLQQPLVGGGDSILLRNVESFRVQYGTTATAAANDTSLSTWSDATGTFAALTAANIHQVRALRVGVLLRSPQAEKRDNAGDCTATATAPQLFGGTPSTLTGPDTAWKCFRFRTAIVFVPLRNFNF